MTREKIDRMIEDIIFTYGFETETTIRFCKVVEEFEHDHQNVIVDEWRALMKEAGWAV